MNALATQIFIPVCCVCGLAREERDPGGHIAEAWCDFDEYVNRHGLRGADYKLTHAYCPRCVHQFVPQRKKQPVEDRSLNGVSATATRVILETIRRKKPRDLEALVRACPQFTWNQVFLGVDRLSKTGDIRLASSAPGQYAVSLPMRGRSDLGKRL
ncbi:MAG: hypothetical protein H0V35_01395 [Nitrospira sp.]|nr:hypothetical protein [Nitrospira sp.]